MRLWSGSLKVRVRVRIRVRVRVRVRARVRARAFTFIPIGSGVYYGFARDVYRAGSWCVCVCV